VSTPTGREPLRQADLEAAGPPAPWRFEVVTETASTNADLLAAAAEGAAEGLVRVAEYQHGGRGRLDRSWTSPPGAGLTFSVLLRPGVPLANWGWLPLLAGVALADTITADTITAGGIPARLKWPNDLLLGPRQQKAAGILAQVGSGAVVIGIGLNVSSTLAELPVATATSLGQHGGRLDRAGILVDFLATFATGYRDWQAAGGSAQVSGLAERYRGHCATLGQPVAVHLPAEILQAEAVDIDDDARLIVSVEGGGRRAIAAGDVTHLRPGTG
jgi:BirA family biotin operon repressor/biotin-[acetyl-CoA-carboxylase] ligase